MIHAQLILAAAPSAVTPSRSERSSNAERSSGRGVGRPSPPEARPAGSWLTC